MTEQSEIRTVLARMNDDRAFEAIAIMSFGIALGFAPLGFALRASLHDVLVGLASIGTLAVVFAGMYLWSAVYPHGFRTSREIRRQWKRIERNLQG